MRTKQYAVKDRTKDPDGSADAEQDPEGNIYGILSTDPNKRYARFVKTTNSHLSCPMYYVQMKRDLAMISPLYETLDEAIAWFEANAPILYPEYFGEQ